MTMGALHDGHRELIRVARRRCAVIVVTVFLNPLQFAPGEDLDALPQDARDRRRAVRGRGRRPGLRAVGRRGLPAGRPAAGAGPGRPAGRRSSRATRGPGTSTASSPWWRSCCTSPAPDVAYFGQKDAQQLLLIRRMCQDLDFPVEVVAVPTVRDPDGLALSSRNTYLTDGRPRGGADAVPRAARRRSGGRPRPRGRAGSGARGARRRAADRAGLPRAGRPGPPAPTCPTDYRARPCSRSPPGSARTRLIDNVMVTLRGGRLMAEPVPLRGTGCSRPRPAGPPRPTSSWSARASPA